MGSLTRLLFKASLVIFAAAIYAGSPYVAAWNLREAVRAGDTAYLSAKIEWDSVRATLAPSLNRMAFDVPAPPAPDEASVTGAKPGLWKRFKAYAGQGAVNRLVGHYVTPEGLPKLFAYRKTWVQKVKGEMEPPKTLANLPERMRKAWARVQHADFLTLTRFAILMQDKHDPGRHFAGVLELRGTEWKLVELRVFPRKPEAIASRETNSRAKLD